VIGNLLTSFWRARRVCSHSEECISRQSPASTSILLDLAVFRLTADSGQMSASLNFAPGSS
jgi:hypothetical protein